jgi:hypothetical protein
MLAALWISDRTRGRIALAWLGLPFLAVVLPWHVLVWLDEPAGTPGLLIATIQHGMYPDFMYQGRPESHGVPYRFDPDTARIASSLHSVLAELARRASGEPAKYLRWYLLGKPLAPVAVVRGAGCARVLHLPAAAHAVRFSPRISVSRRRWQERCTTRCCC